MAQFRTVKAISVVKDGKVVSYAANRDVELDDDQAEALGDAVVRAESVDSMFPKHVIIPAGFAPQEPAPAEVDPKTLVSSLPKPKK